MLFFCILFRGWGPIWTPVAVSTALHQATVTTRPRLNPGQSRFWESCFGGCFFSGKWDL